MADGEQESFEKKILARKIRKKTCNENLGGKFGRKSWEENLRGKLGRKTLEELGKKTWEIERKTW